VVIVALPVLVPSDFSPAGHHDRVDRDAVSLAREAFLARFQWQGGHADVWRAFEDGPTFSTLVGGLAAPWFECGITRVVGVEARGLSTESEPDYRGVRQALTMQDSLTPSDVVLVPVRRPPA
jgi:hypothetical protein